MKNKFVQHTGSVDCKFIGAWSVFVPMHGWTDYELEMFSTPLTIHSCLTIVNIKMMGFFT